MQENLIWREAKSVIEINHAAEERSELARGVIGKWIGGPRQRDAAMLTSANIAPLIGTP
ncbi:hypothetical protein [Sphingomonas guangdongensis]|uniref:hypothetical protein n=1 Tax=Sphingomonas guangdongensis TaxID=1141890 RepID=UPI0015C6C4B1|nr:hypothetical protein [Sphingomonas guangdongensis]